MRQPPDSSRHEAAIKALVAAARLIERPYFVIYCRARSGGNLLESFINQFPNSTCEGELFAPKLTYEGQTEHYKGFTATDRLGDPVGFMKAILSHYPPGWFWGFRLFPRHNAEILAYTLDDPLCRKVILYRRPLDCWVSNEIARATGQWLITAQFVEGGGVISRPKITFDPQRFARLEQRHEDFYRQVGERLRITGQAPFMIQYDMLHDKDVLNGLMTFVGHPDRLSEFRQIIVKQNSNRLRDKVENFEDMQRYLVGRYEEGLENGGQPFDGAGAF